MRLLKLVAVAAVAIAATVSANAQNYPSRQITFLVPNLPGGSSDLIARAVGAQLQKIVGQPVIVDNKQARRK